MNDADRADRHAVRRRRRQRRPARARVGSPGSADAALDRRRGGPGRRARRLLQPRPARRRRRDQAGHHRAGRGHRRGQGRAPAGSARRSTTTTSPLSGTSMATPHVAGAAAILAAAAPGLDRRAAQGRADGVGEAEPGADRVRAGRRPGRRGRGRHARRSPPTRRQPRLRHAAVAARRRQRRSAKTSPTATPARSRSRSTSRSTLSGPDGKPAPAGMFTVEPGDGHRAGRRRGRGHRHRRHQGRHARTARTAARWSPPAATSAAHAGRREPRGRELRRRPRVRGRGRASPRSTTSGSSSAWTPAGSRSWAVPAEGHHPAAQGRVHGPGRGADRRHERPPCCRSRACASAATPRRVVADARKAKPIAITFPDPKAEPAFGDLLLAHSRNGRLVAGLGGCLHRRLRQRLHRAPRSRSARRRTSPCW